MVGRDGLDACVYQGIAAPVNKAPPPSRKPKAVPGEEYESSKPLPPVEEVVKELPEAPAESAPEATEPEAPEPAAPAEEPSAEPVAEPAPPAQ